MANSDNRTNSFFFQFTNCIMCHYDANTNEFDENRWLRPGERGNSLISVELERNLVILANILKRAVEMEMLDYLRKHNVLTEEKLGIIIKEDEVKLLSLTKKHFGSPPVQEQDIQRFLQSIFVHSISVCFWIKTYAIRMDCANSSFISRNIMKLSNTFKQLSQMGYLDDNVLNAVPNWTPNGAIYNF